MPRSKIKESLLELQHKLDSVPPSQKTPEWEDSKSRLDAILESIEETSDDTLKEVVEGINENVSEMEVSHPGLTSSLNQLMNLLSSLGI